MIRWLHGAILALIIGCSMDPYSWDDVVPRSEIPSDPSEALLVGLERLRDDGASVRWAREALDRVAHTSCHRGSCEVTIHLGAFSSPEMLAVVVWHEGVHCSQGPGGDTFTRELPAIRQGAEVLRALGTDPDRIAARVVWELGYYGFDLDELEAALEEHPDGSTPDEE